MPPLYRVTGGKERKMEAFSEMKIQDISQPLPQKAPEQPAEAKVTKQLSLDSAKNGHAWPSVSRSGRQNTGS